MAKDSSQVIPSEVYYLRQFNYVLDCVEAGDNETAHLEADQILLRLVRDLGYYNLADQFEAIPKWYA